MPVPLSAGQDHSPVLLEALGQEIRTRPVATVVRLREMGGVLVQAPVHLRAQQALGSVIRTDQALVAHRALMALLTMLLGQTEVVPAVPAVHRHRVLGAATQMVEGPAVLQVKRVQQIPGRVAQTPMEVLLAHQVVAVVRTTPTVADQDPVRVVKMATPRQARVCPTVPRAPQTLSKLGEAMVYHRALAVKVVEDRTVQVVVAAVVLRLSQDLELYRQSRWVSTPCKLPLSNLLALVEQWLWVRLLYQQEVQQSLLAATRSVSDPTVRSMLMVSTPPNLSIRAVSFILWDHR